MERTFVNESVIKLLNSTSCSSFMAILTSSIVLIRLDKLVQLMLRPLLKLAKLTLLQHCDKFMLEVVNRGVSRTSHLDLPLASCPIEHWLVE